jgi:hypothetical protein
VGGQDWAIGLGRKSPRIERDERDVRGIQEKLREREIGCKIER